MKKLHEHFQKTHEKMFSISYFGHIFNLRPCDAPWHNQICLHLDTSLDDLEYKSFPTEKEIVPLMISNLQMLATLAGSISVSSVDLTAAYCT